MKKNWKIIISALLSAMLLSLPVFAGGDNANLPDDYAIEPRGPICLDCKIGTMEKTYFSETGWVTVDYVDCECEGGHIIQNVHSFQISGFFFIGIYS